MLVLLSDASDKIDLIAGDSIAYLRDSAQVQGWINLHTGTVAVDKEGMSSGEGSTGARTDDNLSTRNAIHLPYLIAVRWIWICIKRSRPPGTCAPGPTKVRCPLLPSSPPPLASALLRPILHVRLSFSIRPYIHVTHTYLQPTHSFRDQPSEHPRRHSALAPLLSPKAPASWALSLTQNRPRLRPFGCLFSEAAMAVCLRRSTSSTWPKGAPHDKGMV